MRFEGRGRPRRGPGLTPLIDVVFLLLVFFMLASRFDREALLPLFVDGPEGATSVGSVDLDPFVIEIDAGGRALIAGQPVAGAELERRVAAAARKERPLRVRPAAEARLQPIVDVLGVIGAAGASDVALERVE